MSDTPDAKQSVRAKVRELRRAISADARAQASQSLAERLLALPEVEQAYVVLGYAANAEEIDVAPALTRLRARGATVAYPRVAGPGVLTLHVIDDESQLVPGALGIREPAPDAPEIALEEVDVAFVPGVAFDESGHRLGYGGGFYDRLLPAMRPDALRAGVAFDEQVLARIPADEHDALVDLVVTPTRTY